IQHWLDRTGRTGAPIGRTVSHILAGNTSVIGHRHRRATRHARYREEAWYETVLGCDRLAPVGAAHRLRRVSSRGTPDRDSTPRGGPAPQPRRHPSRGSALARLRV